MTKLPNDIDPYLMTREEHDKLLVMLNQTVAGNDQWRKIVLLMDEIQKRYYYISVYRFEDVPEIQEQVDALEKLHQICCDLDGYRTPVEWADAVKSFDFESIGLEVDKQLTLEL